MKTILFSLISLTASSFLAFTNPTDKNAKYISYSVNSQQSKVVWNAKKVGGEHAGTAPVKSGALILNGGKLTGGNVEINLKDLLVTDIQDPEYTAKLVSHFSNDLRVLQSKNTRLPSWKLYQPVRLVQTSTT